MCVEVLCREELSALQLAFEKACAELAIRPLTCSWCRSLRKARLTLPR